MVSEFELIKKIQKLSGRVRPGYLGIGDDAAVIKTRPGYELVFSSDAVVDGVDFHLRELNPEKIGRKAVAVNLSDMAAMGAKPLGYLVTLGLPSHLSEKWVMKFYRGLLKCAIEYDTLCLGGDLSGSKQFFANVSIFGEVKAGHAVKRSGACVGDWIGVTGCLGGSILRHHYSFTPRVKESLWLQASSKRRPNSMIDISDGLVQDLTHILKSSKLSACLDLNQLPISSSAKKMHSGCRTRQREAALSDGEDFELLFTASEAQKKWIERGWKKKFPNCALSWIGRTIKGGSGELSFVEGGKVVQFKMSSKGFRHFS